jgi:hypothetical protein
LLAYEELTRNGTSYLWYFPDGTPASLETSTSPDASPADSWGSSAMLYALSEGLAGVVDEAGLFRRVRLAPRWIAADCNEAAVRLGYGASGAEIGYHYRHIPRNKRIEMEIDGDAEVTLHILLPGKAAAARIKATGRTLRTRISTTAADRNSIYAGTRIPLRGRCMLTVDYG